MNAAVHTSTRVHRCRDDVLSRGAGAVAHEAALANGRR